MIPSAVMARSRRAVAALLRAISRTPEAAQLVTPPDPLADGRLAFEAMAKKARAVGIDRPLLWLSFDCDTDADAEAAERIDPWLRARGIRASYAVPGVQLELAAGAYSRLAAVGAEFLNHGYQPHAEWREDRYHPITFYDQMSADEVLADVRRAHEAVLRVTGRAPLGFRAPHFGSFQAPQQLALLHGEAHRLGYSWCSTTVPEFGLQHGPVVRCGDMYEFPLSGSLRTPGLILDSWCHLEDRANYKLAPSYAELMKETVDFMVDNGVPGLLSYYADPAHVEGQPPFFEAMEHLAARGVCNVNPGKILSDLRPGAAARTAAG
jgi:hypothetical protein